MGCNVNNCIVVHSVEQQMKEDSSLNKLQVYVHVARLNELKIFNEFLKYFYQTLLNVHVKNRMQIHLFAYECLKVNHLENL